MESVPFSVRKSKLENPCQEQYPHTQLGDRMEGRSSVKAWCHIGEV